MDQFLLILGLIASVITIIQFLERIISWFRKKQKSTGGGNQKR